MQPYIVFDVNETLLNLETLDPLFEDHFGSRFYRKAWFDQVLKSAFVTTITGDYKDFGMVARSALSMVAERYGVLLEDEAAEEIISHMQQLEPHDDVLEGTQLLKDAGFRMAALTNSPQQIAQAQLDHANISPLLDNVLSVDASGSLKPAKKVYIDAAKTLGSKPAQTCLIAAHPWDIAGAMHAGWLGAFVARKTKVWNPLFETPNFSGKDILEVARKLIASG